MSQRASIFASPIPYFIVATVSFAFALLAHLLSEPAPAKLVAELRAIRASAAQADRQVNQACAELAGLHADVGRLAALLKLQANRPIRVEQPHSVDVAKALDHLAGMLKAPLVCQCAPVCPATVKPATPSPRVQPCRPTAPAPARCRR